MSKHGKIVALSHLEVTSFCEKKREEGGERRHLLQDHMNSFLEDWVGRQVVAQSSPFGGIK